MTNNLRPTNGNRIPAEKQNPCRYCPHGSLTHDGGTPGAQCTADACPCETYERSLTT